MKPLHQYYHIVGNLRPYDVNVIPWNVMQGKRVEKIFSGIGALFVVLIHFAMKVHHPSTSDYD